MGDLTGGHPSEVPLTEEQKRARDTIGTHLYAAMCLSRLAAIHSGAGLQVRAYVEQGAAFGHAFRAAELAFDAGMARNVQGLKP